MIYSCAVPRNILWKGLTGGRGGQTRLRILCGESMYNDRPVDYGARATTTHVDRLIALTGNHEWQPLYASDTDLLNGDRISRISQKHARGPACPG